MSTQSHRAVPSKRNTINSLIFEARQIFAKKGLAGTRIEDIARETGVTKQLIYHYFGTKEMLFSTVINDASQQIMQELIAIEVDHLPPEEALRTLLNSCFNQYLEDPMLGPLALESLRYHKLADINLSSFSEKSPALAIKYSAVLERGIETGIFKPDINANFFLASSALLMSGGFTNHYTMSALIGFDTTSKKGMRIWREHSINLILSSIKK